jgi:triosephosphate isomerase
MTNPIFIANWKMNLGLTESVDLASQVAPELTKLSVTSIICPAYPALTAVHQVLQAYPGIGLGAQNMHSEDKGAFTGEVSGATLKEIGCSHAIIGHSERRQYFNETNDAVRAKVKAAVRNNLIPILCVGETIAQRNNGSGPVTIREQLMTALEGVELSSLLIAYEPVWAIGTGHADTPEDVGQVRDLILEVIKNFSPSTAVSILYGGSVNSGDVTSFTEASGMNGVLVGTASLTGSEVIAICRALNGR